MQWFCEIFCHAHVQALELSRIETPAKYAEHENKGLFGIDIETNVHLQQLLD